MGHIRLKELPRTRKWQHVVDLLVDGVPTKDIAGASADAAKAALQNAREDPALAHSFWLLTQLPLAARTVDFEAAARRLGVESSADPSLLELSTALSDAMDRAATP